MAILVENRKFSSPHILCAPAEVVSLELGIGAWNKKTTVMWLPGRERSLTISSAVLIQSTNVTYRLTDGRTAGDSKDHEYA